MEMMIKVSDLGDTSPSKAVNGNQRGSLRTKPKGV
jgi:hypothetical protein